MENKIFVSFAKGEDITGNILITPEQLRLLEYLINCDFLDGKLSVSTSFVMDIEDLTVE